MMDDVGSQESLDVIYDVVSGHLAVRVELRIAERAAQVTAREADEHRRPSRVVALTLQRVEYIVNSHQFAKFV